MVVYPERPARRAHLAPVKTVTRGAHALLFRLLTALVSPPPLPSMRRKIIPLLHYNPRKARRAVPPGDRDGMIIHERGSEMVQGEREVSRASRERVIVILARGVAEGERGGGTYECMNPCMHASRVYGKSDEPCIWCLA